MSTRSLNASERAALAALREDFPSAFPESDAEIRPLALDTRERLDAWILIRPDLQPKAVVRALQRHCGRIAYKRCLIAGVERIDLDGQPSGVVTVEAQAQAEHYIEAARDAQKTAAQRKQERCALAEARQAAEQVKATERRAKQEAAKAAKAAKAAPKPAPVKTAPKPKPTCQARPTPTVVTKKRRFAARPA
jgi:ProP effector